MLVEVLSLDLFHVWTQKARNIAHDIAALSTDASASATTLEIESAFSVVVGTVSSLNDGVESPLD